MEVIIMSIHFPPMLDRISIVKSNMKYSGPTLGFVYAAKLLYLFELMRHYSPLNTSKGRFVGSLSKVPINNAFLIKTWIKMNPIVALPMGVFWFLIVNSYLLYLME
jgi:hypothetical protein